MDGISFPDLLSVGFDINFLLWDHKSVCVKQCRTLQGLPKISLLLLKAPR